MGFQVRNYNFAKNQLTISYENNSEEHTYSIITGKNAVGKSRLLTSIIINQLTNSQIDLFDTNTPKKIIALSNIKNDKFPDKNKKSKNYEYFGTKSNLLSDNFHVFRNLILNEFRNNKSITSTFNYLNFYPKIILDFEPIRYSLFLSEDKISILDNLIINFSREGAPPAVKKIFTKFEDVKRYLNVNHTKTLSNSKSKVFFEKFSSEERFFFDCMIRRRSHIDNSFIKKLSFAIFENRFLQYLKNVEIIFDESFDLVIDHNIDFLLENELIKIRDIKLQRTDKELISFKNLSSGQQSLLNIFLGISSVIENNSLICIDEPEVNLHPEWQTEFVTKLQELFNDYQGCHFIIATHSPQVVSGLTSQYGYILDLENNITYSTLDYSKKSADYQLAKIFNSPGYNNEYILKICFHLISNLNKSEINSEDQLFIESLEKFRLNLREDDPSLYLVNHVLSFWSR